ncbi:MAG: C40 family peptidase, partial [Rhabdochlamydiaceae bacterium]
EKDTVNGPVLSIPFPARVKVVEDDGNDRWIQVELVDGTLRYVQRGHVETISDQNSIGDLVQFARALTLCESPYYFGGRSTLNGFDCSGLTQMLFREFLDIQLERDAREQINSKQCLAIEEKDLAAGDLIFWGTSKDKVTHVGLFVGNDQFVHANVHELQGKISISTMSQPLWSQKDDALAFRAFRRVKTWS